MLCAIEIKGFRSFSQESSQKIELLPFTVVVGENDTGKSNLLRAIEFALNPNPDEIEREDFNIRESKSKTRSGKVVFKKAVEIRIRLHYTSSAKWLPKEFRRRKYTTTRNVPFELECIASGRNRKSYYKEYRLNGKLISQDQNKLLLSKLKCLITPSIRDVGYLNTLKKFLPVEKSSTINQAVKEIVEVIKTKVRREEALFKKATESTKVSINPILESEAVLKALDFEFILTRDGFPIRLRNHGQGMISKIILSLILRRGVGYLVGLEEPEIHMHPNLIREIVDQCSRLNKNSQIIVVTHSHYLVNFVSVEQILLARRDNKYTKIEKIVPSDPAITAKIESDIFLNRLKTEILFAKGVIFVEGAYDRKVFMQADSKLKNKTFISGVTIVDAGGYDFSGHIALCVKAGIPWAIIADSTAFLKSDLTRGPLLSILEQYLPNKDAINSYESQLKAFNKPSRIQPREINKFLVVKKGFVYRLSGKDISNVISDALKAQNSDSIYKSLFLKLGGHDSVTDQQVIRQQVDQSVMQAKDKMVTAYTFLPTKNELEKSLKISFSRVVRFMAKKI